MRIDKETYFVISEILIMNGSFTMGMITAFQGFLGSFTSPATTLVSAGHTIQEMRTQVERIDDVMERGTHDELMKLNGVYADLVREE